MAQRIFTASQEHAEALQASDPAATDAFKTTVNPILAIMIEQKEGRRGAVEDVPFDDSRTDEEQRPSRSSDIAEEDKYHSE